MNEMYEAVKKIIDKHMYVESDQDVIDLAKAISDAINHTLDDFHLGALGDEIKDQLLSNLRGGKK